MAITLTLSNHYHYQLMKKAIDLSADVLKIILMSDIFVFDKDAHATLADITEATWAASTAYSLDDIVISTTPNGHKYKVTTAGTSGSSEPAWPTGTGETVNDETVVWTEIGADDQLPTLHGYTQNNKTLDNKVLSEDDVNDKGKMICDDVSWTASGGSIGPTGAAIIYDATTADDTVIGCVDYGTDYTIPDGSIFQLKNIEIDNKQG